MIDPKDIPNAPPNLRIVKSSEKAPGVHRVETHADGEAWVNGIKGARCKHCRGIYFETYEEWGEAPCPCGGRGWTLYELLPPAERSRREADTFTVNHEAVCPRPNCFRGQTRTGTDCTMCDGTGKWERQSRVVACDCAGTGKTYGCLRTFVRPCPWCNDKLKEYVRSGRHREIKNKAGKPATKWEE